MGGIMLTVETYSGYKADERPVSFILKDRTFKIAKIVDRWYGADHAYFKVIADDDNQYTMRHDLEQDEWQMVKMEAGSTG